MIQTVGRFVATYPFSVQHVTGSAKGGLAFVEQKFTLTKLGVVFPTVISQGEGVDPLYFDPCDSVYVTSDQYVQAWAKKVYEHDGKSFILVPVESIVLKEKA